MTHIHEIDTDRLRLRQWKDSDKPAFARLNADAETMRFFPSVLTTQESDALAQKCHDLIAQQGWGVWAAEEKASQTFVGFIGLHIPSEDLPFSPCVEIAWRLSRPCWGQGLATEGARAALAFAFTQLHLPEVVAFTAVRNTRSEQVMRRLGMQRDLHTFQHPALSPGHELREHVLYRAFPAKPTPSATAAL